MQEKANPVTEQGAPRVWILASPHTGDNTQLLALARALAWPFEVKRLAYRKREELLRIFGLATLAGVDRAKSSPLAPPWPDLVIAAGRGAEAVGFWLKRHANPRLRFVFIGTPWADPWRFDLVITTPQYGLPQAPNILHNLFPMHDVNPQRIAAEAKRWEPRLAHLPKPFTAVLVGGGSGPYRFTAEGAARLGREASALAAGDGGSLLVTTSARTPAAAADALAANITVPREVYRWGSHAGDNPFHAFLGLATRIVVTADSVSMLGEAVATGKPVLLFDIEEGPFAMRAGAADAGLPPIGWRGRDLGATAFRLLINHAPPRWSRDLRKFHRGLIEAGHAAWLGDQPKAPSGPPQPALERSVARIRALFGL